MEIEVADGSLTGALKKYFGFSGFKGRQEEIISNLLSGKDSFVIMPTGGGKSLCYQLPALISEGTAIIVSPLIALMKNQVDAIRGHSEENNIAHYLNSSLTKTQISIVKDDIKSGATKLLYVAPESLTKNENIEFLKSINVSFFAIDEAHCISEWGHDFRPEYRKLKTIIEDITRRPIIALTATATPKVQQDIQKNLGMMDATVYKDSFNRPNLYYEVRPKHDINKDIIRFIKGHEGKSGIIYCLSRKKVEETAELLQLNGIKAVPYHAGLEANVRAAHQDAFLMEDINVIVATIAFGMGIDKPDVRFVIHYDIPKSLEGYYQETGRAGRDGGEGVCVTYYAYKDIEKLEKFLVGKPIAEQEIGKQLLHEMVSFAESAVCRRKLLLRYFGETYDAGKCDKGCDNCRTPKDKFEGTEYINLLLESIEELKERFKSKYMADFITGMAHQDIKDHRHDAHPLFGAGKDKDIKFWNAVIRQSVVHGFLEKDVETYGTLKLTEEGKKFLENPWSVMLTQNHDYDQIQIEEIESSQKTSVADEGLLLILKDLRKKIGKEKNVPPFVVFQDPSLHDMAIQYPCTMDELQQIAGVGTGKASKFGKPFVEAIAAYVKENDIDRPQDLVIKSAVNKSGLKVYIIQNIDRKVPLEDIAKAKGKSYNDILSEIEAIVASGTKINLDYYISDIVEEDLQDEIFEYFNDAETDSIENAMEEFDGENLSEEDMRLMRVKFLSDIAN
ncbi:MAG: DNA helicase RecQ [Bacteroidetes bacterium]|nr:DNA helicase RecQ [Bacteroidota bacterium]